MAICTRCGAAVADQIGNCPHCGAHVNPFAATAMGPVQPMMGQPMPQQSGPDPNYHGLIPYKNSMALLSYYTGILGLFPCIPVLGIAALVMGIMGLQAYRRDPSIKGVVHAWIGIILGAGATLLYSLLSILILIGMLSR